MKVVAVLLTLLVAFARNADTGRKFAGAVQMGCRLALNTLKNYGNITVEIISLEAPETMENVINGSFTLEDLTLYGLSSLKYKLTAKDIPTEDKKNSKVQVNFNIFLDKLVLETGFDSNITIGMLGLSMDGEGDICEAVSDVKVEGNFIANVKSDLSKIYISDMNIRSDYSIDPLKTTANWKDSEGGKFAAKFVTNIDNRIRTYLKLQKVCVDCVVATLAQFEGNRFLGSKEEKLELDCKCLENSEFNLKEILENILNSHYEEGIEGVIEYLSGEDLFNILVDVTADVIAE